mmetsp:Transcript_15029/g.28271  ORF Transcript_15029/g.28271 Transcript_15029/m.28271 type:complete len:623 (-) Transcript_15029:141-2009(-)
MSRGSSLDQKVASNCPVLLRINLVDCYASSTKVKIDGTKTANDICEVLSTKLGLPDTDALFYSLVCVAKCVDKKSIHWVRTLKANEHMLKVQADMEMKAISRCKSEEMALTVSSSFYYKDIRSNPLDLDGEASGDSSSDDEMEIPLNDLIYFGSGERRGFLQKRSSRDPNVWRRRLCILNDKLWCINVRKNIPWASCVKLNDTRVLEDRPDLKYSNTITLSGNKGQTMFFRTNAPLEKHRWREEIRERTLYGAENEVLMMAEMIITDEEEMSACHMQRCFLQVLRTPQVWRLVRRILDMPEEGVVEEPEKEGDSTGIESPVGTPHQGRGHVNIMDNVSPSPKLSPQPVEGSRRRSRSRVDSDSSMSSSMSSRSRIYSVIRAKPARPPDPLLSKKLGRWSSQIFHTLHKTNPACAAGVSLISAVQHYKGSFRHDFYVPPKRLWGNALYVYIHHILPYMDYINVNCFQESPQDVTREDSEEKPDHRRGVVMNTTVNSEERSSVVLSPSQHISMDNITQLHRALFSNIRKKRKKVHALSGASGGAGDGSSSPTASYSSWFWSTTPDRTGGSRTSSPGLVNGRDHNMNENEISNTDYEVLDSSIKPDISMYDEIVDSVYKRFSEQV